jgi:hypothetical protein
MASGTEQLAVLTQEVKDTDGVVDSATAFILGVAQKIADAVAAAMADGLTSAQLQPFSDLGAEMKAKSDTLAAAIAGPPPPP